MQTELNEEQGMLQDSARKFCEGEIPLEKVREMADDPKGVPAELWTKIAEQGWLGILLPEEYGGLGMGVQELAVVAEELGRALVPAPFLSTVLASNMIAQGGTDAAKTKWLERLATGEAVGTLALIEETPEIDLSQIACTAVKGGDGYLLNGVKRCVADAVAADVFVASAKVDGKTGFFIVPADAAGVSVTENKIWDMSSRSGNVTLENVSVPADALVDAAAYEPTLMAANVCIAATSVAGAERILKLTIEYAKERTQFGVLIGTFQGVKYPLVDFFCALECAKSAYYYAAWAVDAKAPDAKSAVAVARNVATQTYRDTTDGCLQAHGGIAFTWEYDLHLFLKRAKHNQHLYGDIHHYNEVICKEALGI